MVRGWSGSQLGSTRMDWVTVGLLASVRGDDGTAITSSFALCDFEAIAHNLNHDKQHLVKNETVFLTEKNIYGRSSVKLMGRCNVLMFLSKI